MSSCGLLKAVDVSKIIYSAFDWKFIENIYEVRKLNKYSAEPRKMEELYRCLHPIA